MTYSDRAKAFIKTEPHRGLRHRSLVTHFYERILNTGIHRDLIPEGALLDGYRLLFTPFMPYLSSEFIKKASAFAEAGGIWITGPLTGGRTCEHTIHTDCGLGELEKTSGIKTLFTFPMNENVNTGKALASRRRSDYGARCLTQRAETPLARLNQDRGRAMHF